jgi:hypothetical protein
MGRNMEILSRRLKYVLSNPKITVLEAVLRIRNFLPDLDPEFLPADRDSDLVLPMDSYPVRYFL